MTQIKSYLEQLADLAGEDPVRLRDAFVEAGFSTSYYYRARKGGDLHIDTAQAVAAVLGGALTETAA